MRICWIGFGEAGATFATGLESPGVAFDVREDGAMRNAMAEAGVEYAATSVDAARGADLILSLVTADQALAAATDAARAPLAGALYCDMNSVAPDTKRAAAESIAAAGGRYVDVAVMAPVRPKGRAVPLLVSGPDAHAAADALEQAGFASIEVAGERIGDASAVKMIRSVMVKGIEALSAECVLAADAAGVLDRVIASLDASWPGADWSRRFDYNLDRMLVHGSRRAAEMDEVARTLDALGTGSPMSRATAQRQREIGNRSLGAPATLSAKLDTLRAA
ncbi:NAD(P)-dependent oxidoreductase [Sphingosinithalassobacter sp. CS137]|uniref:NAD(P)-dependent oxidoreductase n=1 Tax=Sphingosinithalassobacter sp. CS137 TaxID=2762748 RepID=UPI00165E3328|nr:DUF1932 domain-containing protein [Sphingosinithalassobacter sp. CS137]